MSLDVLVYVFQRLTTPKSAVVDFPVTKGANTDEVGGVKRQRLLLQLISPLGETAEVVAMLCQRDFILQLAHLTKGVVSQMCVSETFPERRLIYLLPFLAVEVVALSGWIVFAPIGFVNNWHCHRQILLATNWVPPR